MSIVDSRVVELIFDNSKFADAAEKSLGTLNALNKSVDKAGNNTALSNLSAAVKSIDFGSVTESIEAVTSRFSIMGIIGATALQNITNRAVNMGISMAKALTIEPVTTGLNEYELKMDNIRTTMVNTGSDLATVNAALDDLNTYSDKTVYKFSDMTNALARLTTSGVKDLDLAKTVIQGMANAAAYAGLTNDKLQSIMYNTSQAYSLGYMSLMDYRSLENAGIGNKFKEVVIETALEMGTLEKAQDGTIKTAVAGEKVLEVTTENLRNTLSSKWMTNDVMTAAFKKYTDESTELGKAATEAATQITTASKLWDTLKEAAQSGWAQNWQLIIGDYEEAKKMWTALNDVIAGEQGFLTKFMNYQNDLLTNWKESGGRGLLLFSIKQSWEAFLRVVNVVKDAFRDIFPEKEGNALNRLTYSFFKFTRSLLITQDTGEKLRRVFRGVFAVFDIGAQSLDALKRIISLLVPGLNDATGGLLDSAASVGDLLVGLAQWLKENDGIYKGLKKVYDYAARAYGFVSEKVDAMISKFEEITGIDVHIPTFDELLETIQGIREQLQPFTDGLSWIVDLVKTGFTKAKEILSSVFGKDGIFGGDGVGAKPILEIGLAIFGLIKAKDAIDPLTALFGIIKNITSKSFNLGGIIDDLGDALGGFITNIRVDSLMKISVAILLLAASVIALGSVDASKLGNAVLAIGTLMTALVGVEKLMNNLFTTASSWKQFFKDTISATFGETTADSMIKLAAAVLILSAALYVFTLIPADKLWQSVGLMLASMAALVAAMWLLQDVSGRTMKGAGAGFTSMGVGILLLAVALKVFEAVDIDKALKPFIIGISAVVLALYALTNACKPGPLLAASAAVLIVSVALIALAAAMALFGVVDALGLSSGIGLMAGSLIILCAALAVMSMLDVGSLLAASAAILVASAALVAIGASMIMFGVAMAIGGPEIMIPMAAALLFLCVALTALSAVSGPVVVAAAGLLVAAAALLVMAAAVLVFAAAMMLLNGVDLGTIAGGMLALSGPMALVGAASVVMAAGIAALAVAILAFAPAALVLETVASAFGIFAIAANGVSNAIVDAATGFDVFVTAVERLVAVKDNIGGIGAAVVASVDQMNAGLKSTKGSFVETGTELMNGLEQGMATVPVAENMLEKFEKAIAGIRKLAPSAISAGRTLASGARSGITAVSVSDAGDMFAQGFINGVNARETGAYNAGFALGKAGKRGLEDAIKIGSPSKEAYQDGIWFDAGFINAIKHDTPVAAKAGGVLGSTVLAALHDSIQNGVDDGIAPVIDMSDVYAEMADTDAMWRPVIKPTLDMSDVNPSLGNIAAITADSHGANASVAPASGNVVNYVQNNYSPKALSRLEIYRQTKNQLAGLHS